MGRISTLIAMVFTVFSFSASAAIECRDAAANAARTWLLRSRGIQSTYSTCGATPCLKLEQGRILGLTSEAEIGTSVERSYWGDVRGVLVVDIQKPGCLLLYVDAAQGDL